MKEEIKENIRQIGSVIICILIVSGVFTSWVIYDHQNEENMNYKWFFKEYPRVLIFTSILFLIIWVIFKRYNIYKQKKSEGFQEIIDLNNKLSEKVQKSYFLIIGSIQKSKFKNTGKALLNFMVKSESLNNSILNSCINKNLYSSWIISRSMIEHNFRHFYIFIKALNEDDDSIGNKYYNSLRGSEDLKSFQKINNYNKRTYPEKTIWSTKGDHNKKIINSSKEFDIEKIFHYIISNNNSVTNEIFKEYKKEYLLEKLIDYTNFSSAIHGGPFSDLSLIKVSKDKEELKNGLYKCAMDSFNLHKNLIATTYLFAYLMDGSINDNIKDYYEEIVNINNKY